MATNLTIRLDENLKREATQLFDNWGLSLSAAITVFLRQSVENEGFPFVIRKSRPNRETLEAMAEANRLATDPNALSFDSMEALMAELHK
ncbi:MAG: type II toxin-antitoxin system RelB/DinJ family antitoxin [Candidatus Spyradenecus sp.]